jgi:hypothetical protein
MDILKPCGTQQDCQDDPVVKAAALLSPREKINSDTEIDLYVELK